MANYECTTRTNYFRVTDEERYKELFSGLCAENIYDLSEVDENGVIRHGFGSYGSIDYCIDDKDSDYCFDSFIHELQKILPEDEAFILMEAGHEKLRYVVGFVTVVTKHSYETMDIHRWAFEEAEKRLGSDFRTQLDY